jgi:hypothetical protein
VLVYYAYGLAITSDTPLPELPALNARESESGCGVAVYLESRRSNTEHEPEWFNIGFDDRGQRWFRCGRTANGFVLRYEGLADFVVEPNGRAITCARAAPRLSLLSLRHLLLDQVFPRVLNLIGRESIHATAVVTASGACAFMGEAGTGKSTLAASFQAEGYRSIADDCLVLEERGGTIVATPGYPGVRLWEDSLSALGAKRAAIMPVAEYTSKARLLGAATTSRFAAQPCPLARIYLLVRDSKGSTATPRIEELTPAVVFPQLVSASFPLDIADQQMLTRHFRLFTRVAADVPARRLYMPNDLTALPAVRQVILQDLAA